MKKLFGLLLFAISLVGAAYGQSVQVVYANLEQANWTGVVGSSISSVPATAYPSVAEADGIRFYESGPAWAGALWKHGCPLPTLPVKGSVSLSFQVAVDDAGALRSQANEFDIMLVDAAGYVYNGSSQLNAAEGGNWQIVNSTYHWTDVGFNPGPLPPGTYVAVSYTMAFDTVTRLSAITSVSVGGKNFAIATPAWIPAQALNWGPNQAVVQVQEDLNGLGGGQSEKLTGISLSAQW